MWRATRPGTDWRSLLRWEAGCLAAELAGVGFGLGLAIGLGDWTPSIFVLTGVVAASLLVRVRHDARLPKAVRTA